MSKIANISKILEIGGHVMGDKPLKRYHDAKKIRDGLRAIDAFERAKQAAKNYRVIVERSNNSESKIKISTFDRSLSFEF
jgi:hypothetical protein